MLQRLKFPLIYILEALLWLPLLAGFFIASLFFRAESIASLNLQGKSLPTHWEAAVYNHGMYLPGYKIAEHPLSFVLVIFLMAISGFGIYLLQKAQQTQRTNAKPAEARAHRLANATVFATVGIISYYFVMHVFVGIAPA